jgi:hypothetical protein
MGVGINSSRFPNTRAYFGKDGHLKLVRLRQVRRKKRLRFKFLGLPRPPVRRRLLVQFSVKI